MTFVLDLTFCDFHSNWWRM